ncbi:MAG: hypothetical protein GY790_18655 [Bacteroidetes bacterium]|nr:hypothetical protein [Bacteroidota bacterium]
MSRFIETIKVLNGEVKNLSIHQARFNRTRADVLGLRSHPKLKEVILVPELANTGLFKCRVLYGHEITKVEFQHYQKPEIRSLKLVHSDHISYKYKSADRSELLALYQQRGRCDDILIVRDGWITDSYTANVVLWDGSSWFTPDTPLLSGTMRALLMNQGSIAERSIRPEDLSQFESLRLINALNGWEDNPEISIKALSWYGRK